MNNVPTGNIRITKPDDMPQALYDAIVNDPYERVGDISVTQLIDPPRKVELIRRHAHELVDDADNRIWALLGQAVHAIIERAADKNALHEEQLTANLDGWVLSGKPDLLTSEGWLEDYKVTSVWSFLLGDKPEWEQQLNVYAWLYAQHGFDVVGLRIQAILRDWQKSKAVADPSGYPQKPRLTRQLGLWSRDRQTDFLWQRVKLHRAARHVKYDNNLPPCTPEERWERPTSYAVKKPGAKKAVRVFTTMQEANNYMENTEQGYSVECRPGRSIRCEDYCLASTVCGQFAALRGNDGGN